MTLDRRVPRLVVVAILGIVIVSAVSILIDPSRRFLFPVDDRRAAQPADRTSMLPEGAPVRFLQPQPVGLPFGAKERPLVAHVTTVDLDLAGLTATAAGAVLATRWVWISQLPV